MKSSYFLVWVHRDVHALRAHPADGFDRHVLGRPLFAHHAYVLDRADHDVPSLGHDESHASPVASSASVLVARNSKWHATYLAVRIGWRDVLPGVTHVVDVRLQALWLLVPAFGFRYPGSRYELGVVGQGSERAVR